MKAYWLNLRADCQTLSGCYGLASLPLIYPGDDTTTVSIIYAKINKAMKPESAASRQMIRFSLDVDNSQEEIREAVAAVQHCVRTLDGSY